MQRPLKELQDEARYVNENTGTKALTLELFAHIAGSLDVIAQAAQLVTEELAPLERPADWLEAIEQDPESDDDLPF